MNHKTNAIITTIVLGWSVIYALYMTFVSLLVMGPRDFNGHPNPLSANIVGGIFLVASINQAVTAVMLAKTRTIKPYKMMLLIAISSCIAGIVGVGHNFVTAINPVIVNLMLLLFLFGIQQSLLRPKDS